MNSKPLAEIVNRCTLLLAEIQKRQRAVSLMSSSALSRQLSDRLWEYEQEVRHELEHAQELQAKILVEPIAPPPDYWAEHVNEVFPDHAIDLAPAASAEDIEALRNEVTALREFWEKSRVAPASVGNRQIDAGDTATGAQSDDQAGAPPIPGVDGATWDDVFDWYYSVPRATCGSLQELARAIPAAYGTVKNRHKDYKAEHSDQKSLRQ